MLPFGARKIQLVVPTPGHTNPVRTTSRLLMLPRDAFVTGLATFPFAFAGLVLGLF